MKFTNFSQFKQLNEYTFYDGFEYDPSNIGKNRKYPDHKKYWKNFRKELDIAFDSKIQIKEHRA